MLKTSFKFLAVACLVVVIATAAPAQSPLLTTFAGGNGLAGAYFDLNPLTPITITGFDIHYASATPTTIEVWVVTGGGSWNQPGVSSAPAPGVWTQVASFTGVVGAGAGVPTPLPPLPPNPNLNLNPGQLYGFYVTSISPTLAYTNGTAVGALFTANNELEMYTGTGVSYSFSPNNAARTFNGNIYYNLANNPVDAAVTSILSPISPGACEALTAAETVTARVHSYGMNQINPGDPIGLSYTVDGGSPILEQFMFTGTLNQGDFEDFSFATPADLSAAGPHTVVVTASLSLDAYALNDSLSKTVTSNPPASAISTFPYLETFDTFGATNGGTTVPPGWSNDPNDAGGSALNGDWIARNASLPTTTTGPTADHTTGVPGAGFYYSIEDTGNFTSVNLISPCIDLSPLSNPFLTFWLHSKNGSNPVTNFANNFEVDVISYPGSVVTTNVFGTVGHIGDNWTIQGGNLNAFAGQVVQFVFRGQSSAGSSVHDICIDDVRVFDGVAGTGQAPQPGLAVLDINNAVDGFGLPVASGNNGIFSTTVTVGSLLSMSIEGAPSQPILLITGPANVGLISFPPLGQFDIGTGIGGGGIPTGLSLFADGTQLTFPNAFFRTTPAGEANFFFTMPALPPGPVTTFQAVVLTGGPTVVAFSNAVTLNAM
ncbi:MAG: hypothetical protein KDB53_04015 [Planctomycetes bacterium]|nr:hypothetical protein [Planctomycetota bacterium]